MAMTAEQVTLMMRELMDSQRQASAELQRQQTEAILANQTVAAKAAEDANAQLMDSMKKFMAEQTEQIKGKGTATAEQTPDKKEFNEGQISLKEFNKAVSKLKRRKTRGRDNIPTKFIK